MSENDVFKMVSKWYLIDVLIDVLLKMYTNLNIIQYKSKKRVDKCSKKTFNFKVKNVLPYNRSNLKTEKFELSIKICYF